MRHGLKALAVSLAGLAVLSVGLPMDASATTVGFEASFFARNIYEGFDQCPIGSACAANFETDTGITPAGFGGGPAWGVQGRLLFGGGGVLTLGTQNQSQTFQIDVSEEPIGGSFLVCFVGGISLTFSSPTIRGRVNFCSNDGDPSNSSNLGDVIDSPPNTFTGDVYITSMQGTDSGYWSLTVNGLVLNQIAPVPEPGTLALLSLGLLGLGFTTRRRLH